MIKLIKLALISVIIYFLYSSKELLFSLLDFINQVISPLIIGFMIAYIMYPILKFLNKFIPKFLGIFLLQLIVVVIFVLIIVNTFPLFEQIIDLLTSFNYFLYNLSLKYNFDIVIINDIIDTLIDYGINKFLLNPLSTLEIFISSFSKFILIIVSSIYFLIDMERINTYINNNTLYNKINIEIRKYFNGFSLILIISFLEYTILYFLINHPNYLLIGFLASIANFIPIFGSIVVNLIAYIAVFNDFNLFLLTIVIIITILLDNFVINPLIYSKMTKIPPILIIFSIMIGNMILGVVGIFIAIPILSGLLVYKKHIGKINNK